jgi:pyruvate dehydrogenase E2 component (dihydrolipoamide acetyltransferase)
VLTTEPTVAAAAEAGAAEPSLPSPPSVAEEVASSPGPAIAGGPATASPTPLDATPPASPTVTPTQPPAATPAAAVASIERGPFDEHPFVTSPLVRRQAAEAGVDLTHVQGSGPAGVITRHDVEEAAHRTATSTTTTLPPGEQLRVTTSSSPYARRLGAERGLDLTRVAGSGPAGAVIARDVPLAEPAVPPAGPVAAPVPPAAAETTSDRGATVGTTADRGAHVGTATDRGAPAGTTTDRGAPAGTTTDRGAPAGTLADRGVPDGTASGTPASTEPPTQQERALAMRLAIARAMERANREIPHYYLGEIVDVEDSLRWLAALNADRRPADRILPAVLVLKATALALQEYPDFNGYWIDDAFVPGEGIHLGVAINLRRGGLLAPAIRDADQRSLDELMAALKDLVQRTRSAGLRGSELTDPTITVSNLGDTGVETIQGVITPPQVALVGAGRITERPWAVDGMLAVRRTISISLAGDHRASDGHRGGRFLAAIAAHLTRAEAL